MVQVTVKYDAGKSQYAHNCYAFFFECGEYQLYKTIGPDPEDQDNNSFKAKKLLMTDYIHPALDLSFQEVGMFKRSHPKEELHTDFQKNKSKGISVGHDFCPCHCPQRSENSRAKMIPFHLMAMDK